MREGDWICCKCSRANPEWALTCWDTSHPHQKPHYRSKCGITPHDGEGNCRAQVDVRERESRILNHGRFNDERNSESQPINGKNDVQRNDEVKGSDEVQRHNDIQRLLAGSK
ncbi:hypothetical protein E2P81_ATG05965 [Venturia nashicola]|uniref:Uncharacterized protein n=1 Tax=Venturia nashicola TaxID=86259 RepID=A0A4Z1P4I5_9PEZI|nr:hypothetical protein E6O75_ATG06111 [Venturia nashicola]TLD29671.1 hypothetical protein E2P81_ATG05965 [Venturia nashicola]